MQPNYQLVSKTSLTKSFNGYEFDVNSDVWTLDKNKELQTDFIKNFDINIQHQIIATLAYYAETRSSYHAVNMAVAIKSYYDRTQINQINELGLLKYKSIFSDKKDEHRLGILRVFLKQMYYLEFDAVNDALMELLNGWKLSGNDKGVAVLSLDPEEGPYSDIEFQAIISGLDNKFAESKINIKEYVLAQIFACTGRRPIQIASIKICDFSIDYKQLGEPVGLINVPRAKVRYGKFRTEFRSVSFIPEIAQVIMIYIEDLKKSASKTLGRQLNEELIGLLPLFPDDLNNFIGLSGEELKKALETDVAHSKTSQITELLRSTIDKLKIISERTGKPLYTTGYRFRYTIGTRAVREGAGDLTVAVILDHNDTQNVKCYSANNPEHAATISMIMNGYILKYANAFQGKIIQSEDEALRIIPNAARIRSVDSKSNLGSCGTCGDCNQYAPIACYVCPKFMPWRDAPHEMILNWLIDERERIKEETNDIEIAAINDMAIIAVKQVIDSCSLLKNDRDYE